MGRIRAFLFCLFVVTFASAQPNAIPTPSQFLGFEVGADYKLADYYQIANYFSMLAKSSPKIEIETLGQTTLGNQMFMAVISSEENLKNKAKYQEIAKKLADPRGRSPQEIDQLVANGKTILLVTANIHSTEIAATQMVMEWAHDLVTATDPVTKNRLDNVILLLVPSLNPDGQIMVIDWYKKYLGTKYEGGWMPWLYHYYIGHDDNRDWFMLTQKETKAMNHAVYFEWYPQVWLDEHQMGSSGPRLFVPPYTNPVSSIIHPLVWRTADHIGTLMSLRLEEQKKTGVVYGYLFDAYWPGATEGTAWWKNIVGLLTEAASTRMGTPVDINETELSAGAKGLVEYKRQTNFPNPWPGGMWHLRDIMDYERIASDALLESATDYRTDFLHNNARMAQDAIQQGKQNEYYSIPLNQYDPPSAARLASILRENGVEILFSPSEQTYYIPTTQPLNRFLKEMLETPSYPKIKMTSGPSIIPPYDVTTWSLPLMMGVNVAKKQAMPTDLRPMQDTDLAKGSLDKPDAPFFAVSHQFNNTTKLINDLLKAKANVILSKQSFSADGKTFPAGTVLIDKASNLSMLAEKYGLILHGLPSKPNVPISTLNEAKIGLYKPWLASMDEGWTRWILEQYNFPFKNIENKTIKAGKLIKDLDVILLPDMSKDVIVDGKWKPEEGEMKYFADVPPEYSGGIGKEGSDSLKKFVEAGGTLVAMGSSCDFVTDVFNVPVSNVLAKDKEFDCPGTLLRLLIDPTHPVTFGLPDTVAAFLDGPIAFQTTMPVGTEMSRKVLAWYPGDDDDLVVSGWLKGQEKLQRHAGVVALTYGKGKIVLLGFRVQNRAQTEGTFKLLFNSLHWAGMKE